VRIVHNAEAEWQIAAERDAAESAAADLARAEASGDPAHRRFID
jgi:hypothetical protein